MTDQAAIETALKAFGAAPDDGIDVGEAALLLAALDRPNLDLAPYRRHLNEIAAALSRIDAGPEVVPRAMAMVNALLSYVVSTTDWIVGSITS